MTAGHPRDQREVEALLLDRYLESLLAEREGRGASATAVHPADLDPELVAAAARLDRDLGRVHPSFRFEERLATEIQLQASRMVRRAARSTARGGARRPAGRTAIVPLRAAAAAAIVDVAAPTMPTIHGERRPDQRPVSRPLFIGGALTSAAISLAGAYVAWRRSRRPIGPMGRAVRAAHAGGLAGRVPLGRARVRLPAAGPRGR